jgi:hypothetical protein
LFLTSFEERRQNVLNKSYNFVSIDIIASCYHKTSVIFTNLKLRKTGIKYKDCIKEYTKYISKDKLYRDMETEYKGVNIITNFLKPYYEVIRLKEGCKADIAIKSINNNQNIWIPVQIKSTNKKNYSMYSFHINNEYDNMLVICVSISEQKIWIVPYNDIKKLNISEKSTYNIYYLNNKENIPVLINNYMDKIVTDKLEVLNTPISVYQKREQEYNDKHKERIKKLFL